MHAHPPGGTLHQSATPRPHCWRPPACKNAVDPRTDSEKPAGVLLPSCACQLRRQGAAKEPRSPLLLPTEPHPKSIIPEASLHHKTPTSQPTCSCSSSSRPTAACSVPASALPSSVAAACRAALSSAITLAARDSGGVPPAATLATGAVPARAQSTAGSPLPLPQPRPGPLPPSSGRSSSSRRRVSIWAAEALQRAPRDSSPRAWRSSAPPAADVAECRPGWGRGGADCVGGPLLSRCCEQTPPSDGQQHDCQGERKAKAGDGSKGGAFHTLLGICLARPAPTLRRCAQRVESAAQPRHF
jgi:hypothetical protein